MEDAEHPDLTIEDETLKRVLGAESDPLVLCIVIQNNAARLKVRMNIDADGVWRDKRLTDLPPELAVWFAMEFLKRRLQPVAGPWREKAEAKRRNGQ